MNAENTDEMVENYTALEPDALSEEPADAELEFSNREALDTSNHSSAAQVEVETTISPVNSPLSLSVRSEDIELVKSDAPNENHVAAEIGFDSPNDEARDTTLTELDSLNNVESGMELDQNLSENNEIATDDISTKAKDPIPQKITQFPLGRIKDIIKSDPDINIVSAECVFLIAKATEMFLQRLGKEIHAVTLRNKKKTLQKKDLDVAISEIPAFEFLEGALD